MLRALSSGMSNREIAGSLGITEETARTHVKNIFSKLDVHDRTAALAEAVRRGLVHIDRLAPLAGEVRPQARSGYRVGVGGTPRSLRHVRCSAG